MDKVIYGQRFEKSQQKGMKDDRILYNHFTCCDKKLEKIFWEGWDWIDGYIIPKEIVEEFKFCPFCGKQITMEENIKNE